MAEQNYDWFFVNAKGEQDGPQTRDELLARWRAGEVKTSSLVWAPGMGPWARFDEVFKEQLPPAPPAVASPPPTPSGLRPTDRPAPAAAAAGGVAIPAAWQQPQASAPSAEVPPASTLLSPGTHPWRRYFAKQLDLFTFAFAGSALLMFALEATSPDAAWRFSEALDNVVVQGLFSVFLWVLGEWVSLAVFGSTLGRALYGIKLTRLDGSPLGGEKAFSRACLVALKGLGLGIPIVVLVTSIVGYQNLEKDGRSTWDADLGTRVSHIVWSPARTFAVISTTVLVMIFAAIMLGVTANAG